MLGGFPHGHHGPRAVRCVCPGPLHEHQCQRVVFGMRAGEFCLPSCAALHMYACSPEHEGIRDARTVCCAYAWSQQPRAQGYITNASGMLACAPCAAGYYAANAGLSVCNACGAGRSAPANASAACLACAAVREQRQRCARTRARLALASCFSTDFLTRCRAGLFLQRVRAPRVPPMPCRNDWSVSPRRPHGVRAVRTAAVLRGYCGPRV